MLTKIYFYAVKNGDRYFRRRGYGGRGEQWVDDLSRATIYPKRAQAVSRVTWWARHGGVVADLVCLEVRIDSVTPMSGHIAVANLRREKAQHRAEVREKRRDYNRAKAAYDAVRK